jgi:hypothetical protein
MRRRVKPLNPNVLKRLRAGEETLKLNGKTYTFGTNTEGYTYSNTKGFKKRA